MYIVNIIKFTFWRIKSNVTCNCKKSVELSKSMYCFVLKTHLSFLATYDFEKHLCQVSITERLNNIIQPIELIFRILLF